MKFALSTKNNDAADWLRIRLVTHNDHPVIHFTGLTQMCLMRSELHFHEMIAHRRFPMSGLHFIGSNQTKQVEAERPVGRHGGT